MALLRGQKLEVEAAAALGVGQRPVGGQALRFDREARELHQPPHSMGTQNLPDANPHGGTGRPSSLVEPYASAAGASASAAGSPAAFAAAFSRSCALALGADFFGVSCHCGFATNPAFPKKMATRSVGSAPCDSQCFARVSSMRMRLASSF